MRMLGVKASLSTFRWDLIHLLAQLTSDNRPGVSALSAGVQALLGTVAAERAGFEQAEDALIVAQAMLNKKDKHRDGVLIEAGGMARALDKAGYGSLFPKHSPSATARLGIDAESAEISRILGELGKMPVDHPVRSAYLQELTEAEAGVKAAGGQSDQAVTAIALQRSQLDRFKLEADQGRLTVHGQLVSLLKDKAEADAFFRPTQGAPADEAPSDTPAPAPAATPAVPTPTP